jgi:ATP-binding cassette subfamily B protein
MAYVNDKNAPEMKSLNIRDLLRLVSYLKPYKLQTFTAILLAIFSTAIAPLRPYLTKIAIDEHIALSDWDGLFGISLIILALLISGALLQFLLTYIMQWIGQKVLYDIRTKLFAHIRNMSVKYFDNNPVGRLVTRVTNDIEALNELFSSGVVMIIADILLLVWIIIFMFYTSWELALMVLIVIPFLAIVSFFFKNRIRETFRAIRQNVSLMNSFLNEFITGITTIKIFSQIANRNRKFDEISTNQTELQKRTITYYALFFPIVEFIGAISLGIILYYSTGKFISGEMTIGILIAFTQYGEMLFRPIRDLTEKYTTLQSAMAAAERVFGVLETEDQIYESTESTDFRGLESMLSFRNVSFSYDGVKQVLYDIDFDLKRGEKLAIVGVTGSGKTSIINLLCRFYDGYKGNILLDGKEISEYSQDSLRRRIGLVMQDVFIFSRSIRENIILNSKVDEGFDIEDAARKLGSYEFISKLPQGFDTVMKERASTLSTGQRQLIAFTRAFASNPDIFIFDEAMSSIDPETEMLIDRSLDKILEGRTSIIIAHRLNTVRKVDRIIVLHHGMIRESGTHDELLAINGIYSRLYKLNN